MPDTLTTRALNRALLARQLLLTRTDHTPLHALHHLIGLQAQATDPPYYGLWTRLRDFHPHHLSELLTTRAAARLSLMRGTLHLVTAHDAQTLRPLLQPLHERAERANAGPTLRHTDPATLDAIADRGRELLTDHTLTFAELGERLATEWPGHDRTRLAALVRNRVSLTQVPPRGLWRTPGPAAHTTTDTWLGPTTETTTVDDLVLRYLAAFGPASVADARTWSGLTGLGEVFDRLAPRLRTFRTDTGPLLHDLPDAPRPDPDTPAPTRLIPDFDNILLSHADRTRVIPDAHRGPVMGGTGNGIIRATALVDGTVAAMWRLRRTRTTATIEVQPLAKIDNKALDGITAEGLALLTTTDPDLTHEVTVVKQLTAPQR